MTLTCPKCRARLEPATWYRTAERYAEGRWYGTCPRCHDDVDAQLVTIPTRLH